MHLSTFIRANSFVGINTLLLIFSICSTAIIYEQSHKESLIGTALFFLVCFAIFILLFKIYVREYTDSLKICFVYCKEKYIAVASILITIFFLLFVLAFVSWRATLFNHFLLVICFAITLFSLFLVLFVKRYNDFLYHYKRCAFWYIMFIVIFCLGGSYFVRFFMEYYMQLDTFRYYSELDKIKMMSNFGTFFYLIFATGSLVVYYCYLVIKIIKSILQKKSSLAFQSNIS